MDEYTIPVYLITGFLESGKTSFLEEVFESGEFDDGDAGIYLRCEQGEEETNASDMVKNMELFGSDPKGLYDLDREYQARTFVAPTMPM